MQQCAACSAQPLHYEPCRFPCTPSRHIRNGTGHSHLQTPCRIYRECRATLATEAPWPKHFKYTALCRSFRAERSQLGASVLGFCCSPTLRFDWVAHRRLYGTCQQGGTHVEPSSVARECTHASVRTPDLLKRSSVQELQHTQDISVEGIKKDSERLLRVIRVTHLQRNSCPAIRGDLFPTCTYFRHRFPLQITCTPSCHPSQPPPSRFLSSHGFWLTPSKSMATASHTHMTKRAANPEITLALPSFANACNIATHTAAAHGIEQLQIEVQRCVLVGVWELHGPLLASTRALRHILRAKSHWQLGSQ